MKNILTKLANLWNRFTRKSEEWEYFEYLRQHPDRTPFIEGKTKAELAQELHDWKMRSNQQAQSLETISKLTHIQSDKISDLQSQLNLQELLLTSMLEEVNHYKNQHQLCRERIKRSYKQVIK